MKANLLITIAIFMTANFVLAQNRDRPSPRPGFGTGGGAPNFLGDLGGAAGGGGPNNPGGFGGIPGASGGGVPGIPDGGTAGGFPGGGIGGGFPGGGIPGGAMPGGMGGMGGGMGMPGLGFVDMGGPNRFQLFAGEVVPEGKDKPLPMILKIDTQTGQIWQLHVGAQNKVRFIMIEGQHGQFNGPPPGFGGHPGGRHGGGSVPVDPTTGLPFNARPSVAPAPQTFPSRPTRPTRRPEPR